MSRTIYALLIGIDSYPSPITPLKGCLNDVIAVEEYLNARVAADNFQLRIHILKNQEATRQAIIDGFRHHLCQASHDDVALFYYSGHGSQEQAPPKFWHLEPDRLNETLVCWDSRTEGSWDLADKELAKLLAEVADKHPHITVILDCCHSGSGTRDILEEAATRWTSADKRVRPLDSFIFSQKELATSARQLDPEQDPTGWSLPAGRHILLAACRDNEKAKEYYSDGQHRGAFCYFLLDSLSKANGSLTYRDLYKRTNAIIRSKIPAQSPQIEASNLVDLEQSFLGGAIAPRSPYFTVYQHNDYGWVIDGGAVHGLPQPTGDETTLLALFPFDRSAQQLRQLSQKIAEARVTRVLPQLSVLEFISGEANLTAETFKAVITSLPLPPLGVVLEGAEAGIDLVRQSLQKVGPNQTTSLYVKEVNASERIDLRVLALNEEYVITGSVDSRPLVRQLQGYTSENAEKIVQRLEHIAQWTTIAELSSPANSQIPAGAVQIKIFQGNEELQQANEIADLQIRLLYQYDEPTKKWRQPTFRVKLKNTTAHPLYCALLDLTEQYSITAGLFPTGGIWLRPEGEIGDEAWAMAGQPLYASVPKELWQIGVTEYKDILKLIVSTSEFDATLLEQDKLDLPIQQTRSASRGTGTLNRLMKRVITRDFSARAEDEEICDDWIASQIAFTTVRPLDAAQVSTGARLMTGVTLQPHPSLKAQARLTTVTESTRDLGNLILPAILRENPQASVPFQFTASRGTDPGLSALELENIDSNTVQSVTAEEPLRLLVDAPLEEDERILPLAFDGEFFLPLGFGKTENGKTEIQIQRLPEPLSKLERDIAGSIRIFFQKIVSEKLGLEFPYPILAIAGIEQDGSIRPEGSSDKVKQRVATANRIAIYIHGIIGDTRSMVATVQQKVDVNGQQQNIADLYDLVLTFDYENLNTSIEKNARYLKQRLESVGLTENHGKTLHIIAHSMGGLVSRWFIEREGGNKIVQHLFMLGTPNAGSPWPTVQAWATPALAFGLNSLSTVAWPVKILATLLTAIETVDVSLDEMQPGSSFLKSLAASPDPGIPYTIVAGNTSIIQPTTQAEMDRMNALIRKLARGVVEFPFFGQPNDIAVAVHSIKSVPTGRSLPPQVQEVACDHLVYFTHEAGLTALVNALAAIRGQANQMSSISPDTSIPSQQASEVTQPTQENRLQPEEGVQPKQAEKPQWFNGFVAGIIVAALAIAGFWLWQRSQNSKPSTPTKTSHSLTRLS